MVITEDIKYKTKSQGLKKKRKLKTFATKSPNIYTTKGLSAPYFNLNLGINTTTVCNYTYSITFKCF